MLKMLSYIREEEPINKHKSYRLSVLLLESVFRNGRFAVLVGIVIKQAEKISPL